MELSASNWIQIVTSLLVLAAIFGKLQAWVNESRANHAELKGDVKTLATEQGKMRSELAVLFDRSNRSTHGTANSTGSNPTQPS